MTAKVFFRARKHPNGTFQAWAPGKELEVFGAKDQKDLMLKCMAIARMNSVHRIDVVIDFPQEQLQ